MLLPDQLNFLYVAARVARTCPFLSNEAIPSGYIEGLAIMEMNTELGQTGLISFRIHQNKSFSHAHRHEDNEVFTAAADAAEHRRITR